MKGFIIIADASGEQVCPERHQSAGTGGARQHRNTCYDRDMARALVNVGAQIAAMTPGELASWLAENLQS